MNKAVLGIVLGGILGAFDGLSALLSAPEVAPEIMGIVIGSTFKGVIVGLIAGFFARKVDSLPLGIAVGLVAGLLFAYWVAYMQEKQMGRHYYWQIMLPGALAGAIVGYATQRFGRRPGAAAAALLLALSASGLQAQTPPADGKAAFERLKVLVGDFEPSAAAPGEVAPHAEFRLTGGGSALVERLFPGTPHEMMSVYYLVGPDLVITHYCAGANQPQLKLASGGATGELVFEFTRGDNIEPATTDHMHGARYFTVTRDGYDAEWSAMSMGKATGSHRFVMKRTTATQ